MPIPAQTAPVSACGRVRWDRAAAMTAAAGIGQGAATPAPQPTSSPAGTDRGTLMPQGRAGKVLADRHRAAHDGGAGEC